MTRVEALYDGAVYGRKGNYIVTLPPGPPFDCATIGINPNVLSRFPRPGEDLCSVVFRSAGNGGMNILLIIGNRTPVAVAFARLV